MDSIQSIIDVVNNSIDNAFKKQDYTFNFFKYLEAEKITKKSITEFGKTFLSSAIRDQIEELDLYINDERASLVKESYQWMGIERAKKLKDYLNSILDDAKRYGEKRSRKRKTSNK
jgi:predicted RND superfamily exporter protein